MDDQTDSQLLGIWVEARSERAFAELVRRHMGLVFCAACRMVGDAHLAQDVTQSVFIALARDAARIRHRRVLSGWLHGTAHNIAAQTIRTDARRRAREQEAAALNALLAVESTPSWDLIAPQLDTALSQLNESDRDAVLLRYFEKKSLREVGRALGTSEDTAQKRISRAMERLREFFARRGVTAGASGLAVLISANAVQAVPMGLAGTLSAAALGETTIAGTAAASATKAVAMPLLQKVIVGSALTLAVGTGIHQARETSALRSQLQTIERQQGPLTEQIRQLTRKRDEAARSLAGLREALRQSTDSRELLRLRAEATRLRSTLESARQSATVSGGTSDPVAAMVESWIAGLNRIRAAVEHTPEAVIPEFRLLSEGDWWNAAKHIAAGMDEGEALSGMRFSARYAFQQLVQPALQKYVQAHASRFPTDLAQLRPYFQSPVDDAVLERWQILPVSEFAGMLARGDREATQVITQRGSSPLDEADEKRWLIQPNAVNFTSFKPIPKP